MRLLDIKLGNYNGIKSGTGLDELYIDLRNCRNNVLLIRGKNGGGKSTLLQAMSPFPDNNNSFIEGKNAYKELTYLLDNIIYHIVFTHNLSNNGKRNPPKAFIQKITENGPLELNPTGNITQYKEIIEMEFGLDPNFILLSSLSNDSRGIVDDTPAERMKYVMIGISDLDVYNNMNKKLSKKESTYKSLVNNLTAKIDNIGNYQNLSSNLNSINNRLSTIESNIEILRNKISDTNSMIKVHDPDGSIQELYNSTLSDLNILTNSKYNFENKINSIINNNCIYITNNDLQDIDHQYKNFTDIVNTIRQKIEDKQKYINSAIIKRDEEYQTLQLKINRLDSIKSEFNYLDIENTMKEFNNKIVEYEKLFSDIGIKNAISITKEEYSTGIKIMREIKDIINALRSFTILENIHSAIDYIKSGYSIGQEIYTIKEDYDNTCLSIEKIKDRLQYLSVLIEKMSILNNRPKNCNINSCSFIKTALEIKEMNPDAEFNKLSNELHELEQHKIILEKNLEEKQDIQQVIRNIDIVNRTIENNILILAKLPNGNMFIDKNEFYNRLIINDSFSDIELLLEKVQYANAFEEYKYIKDNLKTLENEYKLYQSKNTIINEISDDIERINNSINSITKEIDDMREFINSNTNKLNKCLDILKELDLIIPLKNELLNTETSITICNEKLNNISDSMNKINMFLSDIDKLKMELNDLNSQREPLIKQRDNIVFSLKQLEEYNKELDVYMENYNLIRVLKRYSTPSKKSIQQLFISMYMGKTIQLTNNLLRRMFNGELELLPCIIEDNTFAIPVYSHASNMTIDDISSTSTSQKSMASMLLGFALMYQASSIYNIIKLDEIEFGLDTVNRMAFPLILESVRNEFGIEQIIMISHSLEMDKGSFDIIQLLPADEDDEEVGGNIIFKL